ncbi:MAG: Rieske (2Fe-2S) protein [Capsulimonadaceae bacterium]|nr:Rieske (2Fe-2S) protein [Capsulimonadaceae bacterium]
MGNFTRREFVLSVIAAGGALAIAPKLGMADDAPAAPADVYWANMGPVSGFKDAWALTPYPPEFGHKKAFVRVADGKTVKALSPKCPHQQCSVAYVADKKEFDCPCHAGKFDDNGAVISGPPTSPLPTLQSKIEDGNVFVQSLTPPKKAA